MHIDFQFQESTQAINLDNVIFWETRMVSLAGEDLEKEDKLCLSFSLSPYNIYDIIASQDEIIEIRDKIVEHLQAPNCKYVRIDTFLHKKRNGIVRHYDMMYDKFDEESRKADNARARNAAARQGYVAGHIV